MKKNDSKFMERALFLAESLGKYASPNPKVGAVLVRNGRVVGEGAHEKYGGPHAEIAALRKAGTRARGATLYVTLEPCNHYGKTPPCVDAVIRAGVRNVVAAMKDPFPSVRGRGFQKLRKAGISVKVGVLEKVSRKLNESFLLSVTRQRPRVILKAALSLDCKISARKGQSRWITGERARRKAHELRSRVDAILVGSKTALKDNPYLTVRLPGYRRNDGWPLRVVLDSRLRVGPRNRVFQGEAKTVVFTSLGASEGREKALIKKGILVFRVPLLKKMLSLKAILKVLHLLQVRTLLVEGGGEIHASFLKEKLADEVVIFIAPKILGYRATAWVGSDGIEILARAPYLKHSRLERVGGDLMLTGTLKG